MEEIEIGESAPALTTPEFIGIYINGIKYNYSLTKKEEKEKDSLIIKLFDPTGESKYYFSYESPYEKVIKDIKFLSIYESIDEIIDSLEEIFSKGNIEIHEKDGIYNLELKLIGIKKKCFIQLTRQVIEKPKEPKSEIEKEIYELEKKFKDLLNQFEEIKITKEKEIKNKIKEVIFDKEIKNKLFEEMEQMLLSKYNLNKLNNIPEIENNIINKVQNVVDNKEDKINKEINNIQKQLKDNLNYLNNIKLNNNNDNYILLQVKIDKNDLNKDIRLFNQVSTYKYYSNFERDDIEVIIDDKIVPIKFKIGDVDYENSKIYNKKDDNCEYAKKLTYNLSVNFYYYWSFNTTGIHTIKIIFKKKLLQCNKLFYCCDKIYKIDCSHFDCSQIVDCSSMFEYCSSLIEINLGKSDFALSKNFSSMFEGCSNLEILDVSYLNTENSKSFEYMFSFCSKLKEINVSNFKTKNCESIICMFQRCSSIECIDMLNWDMNKIGMYDIKGLFANCSNLKSIKINFDSEKKVERLKDPNINICFKNYIYHWIKQIRQFESESRIFKGLPENGIFIWKKGVNCNKLLKDLPISWYRSQE